MTINEEEYKNHVVRPLKLSANGMFHSLKTLIASSKTCGFTGNTESRKMLNNGKK
jgi:hypothetical protein